MTISNLPIHQPGSFVNQATYNPEEQIDQLELEALEQENNLPEARRAAYRTMIRRELAGIRSQIAKMRRDKSTDYEINRRVSGLLQQFYETRQEFMQGTGQYTLEKARDTANLQSTASKISKISLASSPILREPAPEMDDNDFPDYSSFSAQPSQMTLERERQLILETMMDVRIARGIGEGITFVSSQVINVTTVAAEKVCRINETTHNICRVIKQDIYKGAKLIIHHTPEGLKTFAKKQIKMLSDQTKNMINSHAMVYGIPPEMTKQYLEDSAVLSGMLLGRTKFIKGGVSKETKKIVDAALPRSKLITNEIGIVREQKVLIKMFKELGYEIVDGGKGSHKKLYKPNYPRVTMPKDRELSPGAAKNVNNIYDIARHLFYNEQIKK